MMQKYDKNITLSSYRVEKANKKEDDGVEAKYLLPLMIKKYRDGKFTSKYLFNND